MPIVRWFNAEPKLFESFINKSNSIDELWSNQLNDIYLKLVYIIKNFNISSTESTIPNPNTGSDQTEPRNPDNELITAEYGNNDEPSPVTITVNTLISSS